MRTHRILIAAALGAAIAAPVAHGATIPVTTTLDGPINGANNDGLCSLREAVVAATNEAAVQGCPAGSGADTIVLPAGTFTLTQSGSNEDAGFQGDLDVGGPPVRIQGAGPGATIIQVVVRDRAFHVRPGGDLTLEGLTVRGARMPDDSGANGAGVRNEGKLTIIRTSFEDNVAGDGGFPGSGVPTAGGDGGAIWSGNTPSASVTVIDSTFSANLAGVGNSPSGGGGEGGAIRIASGSLSVSGSTFAANAGGRGADGIGFGGSGGNGGAIAVGPGSATIVNSTFASNRGGRAGLNADDVPGDGGDAGAVWVSGGQALISWSTFLGNVHGEFSTGPNGISGALVGGSILADPEPRCGGVVASSPNLLSGPDGACLPGSAVGDPRLGLLGANGGPTQTLLPGAGSAAINTAGAGCPAADQRGLARPALGACDFGAVEIQPGTAEAIGAPGAPGGPGGPSAVTRTLTGVSLTKAAFRTYGRKKSTTVRFTLGEASSVVLSVRRAAPGRKAAGGRCVAPTRRLAGARRCVRQITLPGRVRKAGAVGANSLLFTGRLRGRALPPGRYTLVLTLPAAGGSPPVVVTRPFRILP